MFPRGVSQGGDTSRLLLWCVRYPFLLGLMLRIFLAWFLPLLLDDGQWIPGVAYTDIDYHVFTDAAHHVAQGRSPYDRHTYRYTPFLAALLSILPKEGGRYLFCITDAICGWIIMKLRRSQRKGKETWAEASSLIDLLWWMYNPFAINICTRGSAESFMVLLPVLLIIMLVTSKSAMPLWLRACLAGIVHGTAVHSKLYPIIYTLSYMAYFATTNCGDQVDTGNAPFPWTDTKRLWSLMQSLVLRLLQAAPLLFLLTSIASFVSLTYSAFLLYGQESLQEGLLYHLSRVDHRHNYSIFWYPIYLARAQSDVGMALFGRLLLIPQLVLLVYSSLGIAPHDLGLALFTQTYLFVTLNKVITAQYFTWYLCLLPLCHGFDYGQVKWSFVLLGLSIVTWLASAYCLEMQGMALHRLVWFASLIYFAANINLLGALLRSYRATQDVPSKKD